MPAASQLPGRGHTVVDDAPVLNQKEGQEALNRSPELCFKLTYRYLLKAGHVPGDTWGGANFGPSGII